MTEINSLERYRFLIGSSSGKSVSGINTKDQFLALVYRALYDKGFEQSEAVEICKRINVLMDNTSNDEMQSIMEWAEPLFRFM